MAYLDSPLGLIALTLIIPVAAAVALSLVMRIRNPTTIAGMTLFAFLWIGFTPYATDPLAMTTIDILRADRWRYMFDHIEPCVILSISYGGVLGLGLSLLIRSLMQKSTLLAYPLAACTASGLYLLAYLVL